MPDVELERPHLAEPQQGRQIVGQQIAMTLVLAPGEHRDRLDELRQRLCPVLLKETLAMDALGHADHGERAIGQVRQHEARDARQVGDEVALGDRRLPRRLRGPVDTVEVGELDARRADGQYQALGRVLQLLEHRRRLRHRRRSPAEPCAHRCAGGARHGRIGAAGRSRDAACGYILAQAQKHRSAQRTPGRPLAEADLRHQLRFEPGRGTVQRGLFGKRRGFACRAWRCARAMRRCCPLRVRSPRVRRSAASCPGSNRAAAHRAGRVRLCRACSRRSRTPPTESPSP